MIVLFTDFGSNGPYQGQMIASLRRAGYDGDIVTLFADAPVFSPHYSACLLKAYHKDFPAHVIFLCVVDPGVGSDRKPVVVRSHGQWFVGPDNGLFEYLIRDDPGSEVFEITWSPPILSASFHGRDLFAPVTSMIAASNTAIEIGRQLKISEIYRPDWQMDIAEIIYIDHYGNCMTGLQGCDKIRGLTIEGQTLSISRTFSDVSPNNPLVYVNSNGLIEVAVNQSRAVDILSLKVGTKVTPVFQS
jgi:S-adenosylmethionine hydrolase